MSQVRRKLIGSYIAAPCSAPRIERATGGRGRHSAFQLDATYSRKKISAMMIGAID
jgi:hypothetical protein